jgi:hypothetical protein
LKSLDGEPIAFRSQRRQWRNVVSRPTTSCTSWCAKRRELCRSW